MVVEAQYRLAIRTVSLEPEADSCLLQAVRHLNLGRWWKNETVLRKPHPEKACASRRIKSFD
jgi:hypothetical protein